MGEEQPEVNVVAGEREGRREKADLFKRGGEEAHGLKLFERRDTEETKEASGEADG